MTKSNCLTVAFAYLISCCAGGILGQTIVVLLGGKFSAACAIAGTVIGVVVSPLAWKFAASKRNRSRA